MRVLRVVLVGAVVTLTACGGHSVKQSGLTATTGAPLSSATAGTVAARTTSTTRAVPATTTVASASTVTSAATVTSESGSSAAGTTTSVGGARLCPDGSFSSSGECQVTVPLRPDSQGIVDIYRQFAAEDLRVSQSPDGPDWGAYLALVHPDSREAAKADIQGHFDRGEVLNVSLGVSLSPHSTQASLPPDYEILEDCRSDGSYWTDRLTGGPVAGQEAAVRTVVYVVNMQRVNGKWLVAAFRKDPRPCAFTGS